jgi:hypothetical protein
MSYPNLTDQATAVTAALAELDVHPGRSSAHHAPRRSGLR